MGNRAGLPTFITDSIPLQVDLCDDAVVLEGLS